MTVQDITALPVIELAASDAHLYLWTTSRYLPDTFSIIGAWGFRYAQTLVWCKPPWGLGPGGSFANTAEFIILARRGKIRAQQRQASSWWEWPRGGSGRARSPHSTKPSAFLDLVEQVSPPPRVELFARAQRLGWDSWGWGYEDAV